MDVLSSLERRPANLGVGKAILIHKLPTDVFHRIFILLLPSPDSMSSPTDETSVSKFFKSTAPYNISLVCRSWREFVLSTASLWSEFSLSFSDPSSYTLQQAKSLIAQHLRRSRNLPLTGSVMFKGTFDEMITRTIAALLVAHQKRWRRVALWFEVKPQPYVIDEFEYDSYDMGGTFIIPVPVHKHLLFTEDMVLLEDLSINFAALYHISATPNNPEPGTFPSLTRLTLEMAEDYKKLAQWLAVAPNVKELNLAFYSEYLGSRRRSQASFQTPTLHMAHLQTIRDASSTLCQGMKRRSPAVEVSAFVVRFLVCPALTEIHLRLDGDAFVLHASEFFLRSAPPLQVLDLSIVSRPSQVNSEATLVAQMIETLALLPSLSEFRMTFSHRYDTGPLLQALAGTRTDHSSDQGRMSSASSPILPALERIELRSACALSSDFVELISARWRVHGRTLRSFTLSHCSSDRRVTRRLRPLAIFPMFRAGDDPSDLHEEWEVLKGFISEGLHFEIL